MRQLQLISAATVLVLSLQGLAFAEGKVAPVTQYPGAIQETIVLGQAQQPDPAAVTRGGTHGCGLRNA